jgi:glycosyltransferase involved in cell wall biosynthesis
MDVLSKTDDVFIYARGGEKYAKGNPQWDMPNVYWGKICLGKKGVFGGTYIDRKDFEKWLKGNLIDAVLFNEQQWFQPMLWCKTLGVKSLAYIDYYNEKTIPLFGVYDALICNTKRHAFAFREHPHVNYLKWGTDVNLYQPKDYRKEKMTFFHSAGMAPIRKGTDVLLHSFYNAKERKKALLLIHTQVDLQSFFPELKDMIREMQDEGSLELVTKTITAPGLYYKGDVYIYPSRLDGIGLTLMEAISSGMAVVTTDNPPMNEFVEPVFGQLCKVDYQYSRADGYYWPMCMPSIESLTTIIEDYIDGKYDLSKMKLAARKYALKELNFQDNCKALHSIFKETEIEKVSDKLVRDINSYDYYTYKAYHKLLSPVYFVFKTLKNLKNRKRSV